MKKIILTTLIVAFALLGANSVSAELPPQHSITKELPPQH